MSSTDTGGKDGSQQDLRANLKDPSSGSTSVISSPRTGDTTSDEARGDSDNHDIAEESTTVPIEPDEDVSRAISNFVVPEGYTKVEGPLKHANRSAVWVYGVKAKTMKKGKTIHVFFCLASSSCRAGKTVISVGSTSTTNALNHLRLKHGVFKSLIAERQQETTSESRDSRAQATSALTAPTGTPKPDSRAMLLIWIQAHVIKRFCPLSFGEDDSMQACLGAICKDEFPVLSLYSRNVKHKIVEMYAATAERFKQDLLNHVSKAQLLHLTLDLWVDRRSSLKFIGVRVWYVDPSWNLRSRLLAVRQFNPTAYMLEHNRLSALLHEYVTRVFSEFGISERMLVCSITDAGSVLHRVADKLMPSMWEWSIPHMLSCALVEGFGTSAHPEKSKSPAAREVLKAVKETVERIRRSPNGKELFSEEQADHCCRCLKFSDIAPQRWAGLSSVLRKILVCWPQLNSVADKELGQNPICNLKTEIQELYSLVKPVSLLMSRCRATSKPTGAEALLHLAELKLTTLDASADLQILTPVSGGNHARETKPGGHSACKGVAGVEQEHGSDAVEGYVLRSHAKLTPVARVTRLALQRAVNWRWYKPRYDPVTAKVDCLLDLQTMCHPATARLMHLRALAGESADSARTTITTQFVEHAVGLADAAEEKARRDNEELGVPAPPSKRVKSSVGSGLEKMLAKSVSKADVAKSERFAKLGLFAPVALEGPAPRTHEAKAREELDELINIPGVTLANCPLTDLLDFWKTCGASRFPLLARVARRVLGAPASSAVIERDLSAAGSLVMDARRSNDASWAEMVLFLNGNTGFLPANIPMLSAHAVEQAIPERLRSPHPDLDQLTDPSADAAFENERAVAEQPAIM